jgi:hypothetical protein
MSSNTSSSLTPDTMVFSTNDGYGSQSTMPPGIYVMNTDGTGLRMFLPNVTPINRDISISADGRRLAYKFGSQIIVTDLRTKVSVVVVVLPQDISYGEMIMSPDGTKIIFSYATGFPSVQIVELINVDGTERRTLLNDASDFDWTSDSQSISYKANNYPTRYGVWKLDINTGSEVQIVAHRDAHDLAWSPDGSRYSYRIQDVSVNARHYDYVASVGSSTPNLAIERFGWGPGPGRDWSPDSTQFAHGSGTNIMVTNATTGTFRVVASPNFGTSWYQGFAAYANVDDGFATLEDYQIYVAVEGNDTAKIEMASNVVLASAQGIASRFFERFVQEGGRGVFGEVIDIQDQTNKNYANVFRAIMTANNEARLGFVFMDIDGDINTSVPALSIPENVNEPTSDYIPFRRICPFFVALNQAGATATPANYVATNPGLLPYTNGQGNTLTNERLQAVMGANTQAGGYWQTPHQALIICDLDRLQEMAVTDLNYNMGLVFLHENGGTAVNTLTDHTFPPNPQSQYIVDSYFELVSVLGSTERAITDELGTIVIGLVS